MIPGFVQLGVLAVLFQLAIIAGFYGYLRWRHPAPHPEVQTHANWTLGAGIVLTILGQFAGLAAVGSLRTVPLLSFQQAMFVQNAGLVVAIIGYLVIIAGFVLYSRSVA